mgnify:CR=1 FL=1
MPYGPNHSERLENMLSREECDECRYLFAETDSTVIRTNRLTTDESTGEVPAGLWESLSLEDVRHSAASEGLSFSLPETCSEAEEREASELSSSSPSLDSPLLVWSH